MSEVGIKSTNRQGSGPNPWVWVVLWALLPLTAIVSMGLGRYHVPIDHVVGIVLAKIIPLDPYWSNTDARVVELIRLPRILLAMISGAGLALCGTGLQGIFRNPLVGPQIIGVSSGAGFGGALGILLFQSQVMTVGLAFTAGLVAMAMVFFLSRTGRRSPILMLVLAGVIASAFFTALISLIKYVADPYEKLPAIVVWLMGTLSTATYEKLLISAVPIVLAGTVVYLVRFRINVISIGDEEAEAMGIKVEQFRWLMLICVTLITSAVVSVAGIIGWIGLVVPHIARMLVGADHRVLVPASALIGGVYLLIIDDLARTATPAEIPLGIITAIIGAPVFGYLLKKTQAKGWKHD